MKTIKQGKYVVTNSMCGHDGLFIQYAVSTTPQFDWYTTNIVPVEIWNNFICDQFKWQKASIISIEEDPESFVDPFMSTQAGLDKLNEIYEAFDDLVVMTII